MYTLRCRDKILHLDEPKVMVAINITPDSFFEASRFTELDKIMEKVENSIDQGASIIDIGAMSSRPGAEIISPDEEMKRLEHILPALRDRYPDIILSIDTMHSAVAEKAIKEWQVDMINDISANIMTEQLAKIFADSNVAYTYMHMQGRPENMQNQPRYKNLNLEILTFLKSKYFELKRLGILDLVIDPGIGFGKSVDDNFSIIKNLSSYKILGLPILIGLSRKSFIYKTLGTTPEQALNGTSAMHMMALQSGANILRVHDPLEAKECIDLYEKYKSVG